MVNLREPTVSLWVNLPFVASRIPLRDKRGIFFTTLACIILILFLTSYTYHAAAAQRATVHERIASMNSFLAALESDLARQAYIAGFRTLVVFEQQVTTSGSYLQNLNASVHETFANGTYKSVQQSILQGATISDIQQALHAKAQKMNINVTLSAANLTLTQEEPWKVTATLRARLLMEDATGIARWNKTLMVASKIDIQNFNDPLYTVKTQGKFTNKINRSLFEPFVQTSGVQGGSTSVVNLTKHLLNSSYTNTTDAPSYLDRLQGLTAPNPHGIESLVNVQKLSSQGIPVEQKSLVDHIYFSSQNPSVSAIEGMPSWFLIDEAHVDRYGVRHLSDFS